MNQHKLHWIRNFKISSFAKINLCNHHHYHFVVFISSENCSNFSFSWPHSALQYWRLIAATRLRKLEMKFLFGAVRPEIFVRMNFRTREAQMYRRSSWSSSFSKLRKCFLLCSCYVLEISDFLWMLSHASKQRNESNTSSRVKNRKKARFTKNMNSLAPFQQTSWRN